MPQTIIGNFAEFLEISRALRKSYSIFYNGPKCGSSAPDHMHFQAGTKHVIPLSMNLTRLSASFHAQLSATEKLKSDSSKSIFVILFRSNRETRVNFSMRFKTFINAFKKISLPHNEPLMNLISKLSRRHLEAFNFSAAKTPPTQFSSEEKKQLLISPAAVDMGGLFITPRKEDFEKITKDDVIDIFKQVTITKEYFEFLRKKIGEIFI